MRDWGNGFGVVQLCVGWHRYDVGQSMERGTRCSIHIGELPCFPVSKNRKQHMLQAAYLAGFSPLSYLRNRPESRRLPIWLLEGSSMRIFETTVGKATTEPYLYSFRTADGSYSHAVDEAFQRIESQLTPVMNRVQDLVASYARGEQGSTLSKSDHIFLIRYLYMHSVRTARIFNWIRKDSRDAISRWNSEYGAELGPNDAQFLALKTIVHVNTNSGERIAKAFFDRCLSIESIPRARAGFVTTDSPVVLHNPSGPAGLAYPECQVLFPLNQYILLRLEEPGPQLRIKRHRDLSIPDQINMLLMSKATQYVIGRDPYQLASLCEKLGRPATRR